MTSARRRSGAPMMAVAAVTLLGLCATQPAHARSAAFKASIQFEESLSSTTTSTEAGGCNAPRTSSQTVRFNTTRPEPVTAHVIDAGSSRGLVELGPSGSGYAQIPAVTGTIERRSELGASACEAGSVEPQDCGLMSPKRWEVLVQPQSVRRSGREQLRGLGVGGAPVGPDPFSSCPAPEQPPLARALAAVATSALFDKHRRRLVLHIAASGPWHLNDKVQRRVVDGKYAYTVTLTLQRTR